MSEAWIFPGQGSQSPGMARGLFRSFAPAKEILQMAEQISGLPLDRIRQFGPGIELRRPDVVEPLLAAVNIGYAKLLMDCGRTPCAVSGYSAGEVAALFACGALSAEDAIRAAVIRGRHLSLAVSEHCKMVAVTGLTGEQIQDCLIQYGFLGTVEIAGWNSIDQLTIVGDIEPVMQAEKRLVRLGAETTNVEVSGPWHSPVLRPVSDRIFAELATLSFNKPTCSIYTSLSGCLQDEPNTLRRHLAQQVSAPVLWKHILASMRSCGIRHFYELGSGRVLFGLVRRNFATFSDYDVACAESHSAGIASWVKQLQSSQIAHP